MRRWGSSGGSRWGPGPGCVPVGIPCFLSTTPRNSGTACWSCTRRPWPSSPRRLTGSALRWVPPRCGPAPGRRPVWGREGAMAQEEPVFRGLLGQSTLAPPTQPAALVSLVSPLMGARRGPCPGAPGGSSAALSPPLVSLPILAGTQGISPPLADQGPAQGSPRAPGLPQGCRLRPMEHVPRPSARAAPLSDPSCPAPAGGAPAERHPHRPGGEGEADPLFPDRRCQAREGALEPRGARGALQGGPRGAPGWPGPPHGVRVPGRLINTIRVVCASYEDYSHWVLCLQTVTHRAGAPLLPGPERFLGPRAPPQVRGQRGALLSTAQVPATGTNRRPAGWG